MKLQTNSGNRKHEEDEDDYDFSDKWRYSLYSAIVFFIVSASSPSGSPKLVGVLLRAFVFMLIIRGMMELDI